MEKPFNFHREWVPRSMKNAARGDPAGDQNKPGSSSGGCQGLIHHNPAVFIVVLVLGVSVSGLVLFNSTSYSWSSTIFSHGNVNMELEKVLTANPNKTIIENMELEKVLNRAANPNKTVIITISNQAWAAPNSIVDLFLESFSKGNGTKRLLDNLVIVSLDHVAHAHCLQVHRHCYEIKFDVASEEQSKEEAYFMTPVYLKMVWRRILFLTTVLEMGYNFVFTDADIMWLQDPFPHFFLDADFQIACDKYNGNPNSLKNSPNGGLNYVKSNNRTIHFYKYWYYSREAHPGKKTQDVFNLIKHDHFVRKVRIHIKFLSTAYFGGFCAPSRDFNLVCTMHANCCFGLQNKVQDLKLVLEDWTKFYSLNSSAKAEDPSLFRWRAPQHCRR